MTKEEEAAIETAEETEEEMRKRHKSEVRQLEGQTRAMLKKAPKPKKTEVQGEVAKMERDMEERHTKELMRWAEGGGGGGGREDGAKEVRFAPATSTKKGEAEGGAAGGGRRGEGCRESDEEEDESGMTEAEKVARKRDRARRKKERKAKREAERQAEIEEAKKHIVPPREIEMKRLLSLLSPMGLDIFEVAADGHCLYRSVAHQLASHGHPPLDYQQVRRAAAQHMREHPHDFIPFLAGGGEEGGKEGEKEGGLEAYVQRVEGTAEWGGELEIRALCHAYQRPIRVFAADAPEYTMGESDYPVEAAVLLSYHRQFYALGEHYNSVVPVGTGEAEERGEEYEGYRET